jgi:ATP adenylyltransferase
MLRQRERALASGDLQPTQTEETRLEDAGHRFTVRRVVGRDAKRRSDRAQAKTGLDPFLPPYPDDLYVGEISATHVALLNKFPVARDHLLIVTREFEPQERVLTLADFEALAACMDELDGLAFYNAGAVAGASQPHKHLQLVPLPIGTAASRAPAPPLPTAALFEEARFRCARARIEGAPAAERHAVYRRLLAEAGLAAAGLAEAGLAEAGLAEAEEGATGELGPYNLLVTRDLMWVVPRSRISFEGIGSNALGYAGSLLVRTPAELATLRALGPLCVLAEVGVPIR